MNHLTSRFGCTSLNRLTSRTAYTTRYSGEEDPRLTPVIDLFEGTIFSSNGELPFEVKVEKIHYPDWDAVDAVVDAYRELGWEISEEQSRIFRYFSFS